jgi:preprotein translocase subunit SecF
MVQENFHGDMARQTVLCIVLPLTLLILAILAFNVWNLRKVVDQQGSTIMKLRWESKTSAELDQI